VIDGLMTCKYSEGRVCVIAIVTLAFPSSPPFFSLLSFGIQTDVSIISFSFTLFSIAHSHISNGLVQFVICDCTSVYIPSLNQNN